MAKKYYCKPCMETMIEAGKVKNVAEARSAATRKENCERCGRRKFCRPAEVRGR